MTLLRAITAGICEGTRDGLLLVAPVGCVFLFATNMVLGFEASADGLWLGWLHFPLGCVYLYWLRVVWPHTRAAWARLRGNRRGRG